MDFSLLMHLYSEQDAALALDEMIAGARKRYADLWEPRMEMILRAVLRVIAYANIGKPAGKCLGAVQARLLLTASSFRAAQRLLKSYLPSRKLDWLAQPLRDIYSSAKGNVSQVVQSALKVL